MIKNWRLEEEVKDYIKRKLDSINIDYSYEQNMSDYMKDSLKGSSKTNKETMNSGVPDFQIETYNIPIIIETKRFLKKLISETKDGIKIDSKTLNKFAVNDAIYYATQMIASGKYSEVIAIGVSGDSEIAIDMKVYYVYGSSSQSIKLLDNYTSFHFLENEKTFKNFYKDAILTEEDKHKILIESKEMLNKYSKKLNKLMHNLNITAPQRVLYVSGMLLAMQDIIDKNGYKIKDGLTPDDLKGIQTNSDRDGVKVVNQIREFLKQKDIEDSKRKLMLDSFSEISKDSQRDQLDENDKEVSKLLEKQSSCNKQIFTFIYEYIYKQIDSIAGHIDIMGEMYSEFLKYALGDGKDLGIVLTPPYVTKMMAQILNINKDSRVMDLATGSASFLISSMEIMIDDINKKFGKDTTEANKKIAIIKKDSLLGVELNAEMYTLATTNMILRGDGSSNIQKGNTFQTPEELYSKFKANKLLLNPPFSLPENGMPFIEFGLNKMQDGGLGAIIIQDSAGNGKAISTNKKILKKHSLIASIKMPQDLFNPMAGVQTSIYVFEANKKHDFDKPVKFIDFRNDGYKRTKRGISEIDNPVKRYKDIIKIYKAGKNAKVDKNLWNLDEIYFEDFISNKGNDWNFDQHKKIDIIPTINDFKDTVSNYLKYEIDKILSEDGNCLGK